MMVSDLCIEVLFKVYKLEFGRNYMYFNKTVFKEYNKEINKFHLLIPFHFAMKQISYN